MRTNAKCLCSFIFIFTSNTLSAQIRPNIVGGGNININQVPYQALLDVNGTDDCGTVIISPNYVLTAGHCVVFPNTNTVMPLSDFVVYAGITDRTLKSTGQNKTTDRIILNPNFNPTTAAGDIAIIHLSSPLTMNANVAQIPIATQNDVNAGYTNDGVTAQVSGWGLLGTNGTQPNILQALNQTIVDNNTINPANYVPKVVTASNLPTAGVVGHGPCYGDSGGPLTVAGAGGTRILAGLVDFGDNTGNCATANPNIYVRISSYTNFIVQNTASLTGTQPCCAGFSTTYTLNALAPLTGVTWITSSDFTPTSGNTNTASFSSANADNMNGTLTFSYSTPQGGVIASPFTVGNGQTIWASLTNSGTNTLGTVNGVSVGQHTVWVYSAGASSFTWSLMGSGISWTPNGTGTSMTFILNSGQSGTWVIKPGNRCTSSIRDLTFTTGFHGASFNISQHESNLIVTATPPAGTLATSAYTFNVELLNATTNSIIAAANNNNRVATINVSSLSASNSYSVKIIKDTDTVIVPVAIH